MIDLNAYRVRIGLNQLRSHHKSRKTKELNKLNLMSPVMYNMSEYVNNFDTLLIVYYIFILYIFMSILAISHLLHTTSVVKFIGMNCIMTTSIHWPPMAAIHLKLIFVILV